MKAWVIHNEETFHRLRMEDSPRPEPKPGEILLKVAYAALNRADLFQLQGQYPLPEETAMIPGLEASGIVEAVGEGVSDYKKGDRVAALMTGGAYAEYCTVPATQCLLLPDKVSLQEGATLPEVLATVWLALFRTARFTKGETVLVHGGSSGIGTAAIQIITLWGGNAIVTAGTHTKCDFCTTLGATAINYKTEDFVARVKELTQGRGADIVIDIIGGDYIEKNIRALAPGGRMVSLSFINGAKATAGFGGLLMKNLQWSGMTLRAQPTGTKHEILSEIERDLFPHLLAGRYKAVIDTVFQGKDVEKAHSHMQESLHIGKILLDMNAL